MATLTLKNKSGNRIEAARAKEKAVQRWADGKVSTAQRDKAVSAANEKLRT
jgi:hypothetical protein